MPTVLITGGTGMIGKFLSKALLGKGYNVIILTRDPGKAAGYGPRADSKTLQLSFAEWNITDQTLDNDAIKKADYIIHLAGASVAEKRWTEKRKKEIVSSRVKSSELLVKALKENQNKVKAIVSASAIGWYGSPSPAFSQGERMEEHSFIETDSAGNDFLGQTCKLWEESIQSVTALGKRLVKLRIGIVLSNEGGALFEYRKPLRFGIAAILGSGNQMISWIHIDDLVQLFIYSLENERLNGVYNAVAPGPVSNKELVLSLAKAQKGKYFIPVHVPAIVLKLMLGEFSREVLKSAKVNCEKILNEKFVFQYPTIETVIQ